MKVTDIVTELARPVVEGLGYELWDVEYLREMNGWCLRVYIDKPGGVSINDCETVSRALDPVLDERDPIADSYVFEVSSAGAERELKRPSDFERFMGETVEVRLYQNLRGSKSHIGKLRAYNNGDVEIEAAAGTESFTKSQIAQIRLRIV